MNTQSFRTRKPSYIKSYQQLLLNKVNYPSQNIILKRLKCIKPSEFNQIQQRQHYTNQKLDKFERISEPSSFIIKLVKLCKLENVQTHNEQQKRTQQHYLNRQVQNSLDQDNIIRFKSNQMRVRQLSNDFLTDRIMRSNVSKNTKKVRFYEKIEYWVLNKDKNVECDYRYFEPLKLQ